MSRTKLDIKTIQNDVIELDKVLNKITKPATNILYTKMISRLKMGGKVFGIEFDTALYSCENDILILIKRGPAITLKDVIKKLEERNIDFSLVEFASDTFEDYEEEIKEICFARDGSALKEYLRDSKNKGNEICRYNPVMKGRLTLKYPGRTGFNDECEEIESIYVLDRLHLRGIVETEDKMILLINDHDSTNVYYKQVLEILSETGMTPIVEDYDSYDQKEKSKTKVKTKEDE